MSTNRDTSRRWTADLREGRRARAHYRGGEVEGEVVEVRHELPGITRVVLDVGGDIELDTDASRVEVLGRFCPQCAESLSRVDTYRCPSCGADLVADK
jgi:ribosomal protein S27AE